MGKMTNDQILMTNQGSKMSNDETWKLRHWCFVIDWSFVLGHWSFLDNSLVIRAWTLVILFPLKLRLICGKLMDALEVRQEVQLCV
jgi:hypothetical protein